MSVNCLILCGDNEWPNISKHAGPHRIATELRNNNYTVQCVDISGQNNFNFIYKKIVKKFVGKETLWVGFSTNYLASIMGYKNTHNQIEREIYHKNYPDCDLHLKEFMAYCKQQNPNIKFIVGGILTFDLSHLGFYTFKGNTEKEIVDFTNNCARGIAIEPGVFSCYEFKNFQSSKTIYLPQDIFNNEKSLTIEVSRGCIFDCKFCNYGLRGKKKLDYIRDASLIKEELIYNYENFGITHYNFSDDTYNDSMQKMEFLYDKVFSQLPFDLSFVAYCRLDLLLKNPEMSDLLKASGIKSAIFGLESLDVKINKIVGKGVDPHKQLDFLRNLKETSWQDILVSSQFILGMPGDSVENIEKTAEWIMSKDNFLDHCITSALFITPSDLSDKFLYTSDFDRNYKNYGYEMFYDKQGKFNWINKEMNLDFNTVAKLSDKINSSNLKNKFGRFSYSIGIELGYTHDQLLTYTKEDLKNNFQLNERKQEKQKKYFENLFRLSIK